LTVRKIIPIEEYTGNGIIDRFDWEWDMIGDSAIEVLVDNEYVEGWSLQGESVIFDVPPDDGAFIQIYRRTKVWMPEDYVAFGRFHANKTELSVDRAIMIAQERAGDRGKGNVANGIVGGANLQTRRHEFSIDVVSERGSDANIPMWSPDPLDLPPGPIHPPDPSILWGGADLKITVFSVGDVTAEAILRFYTSDRGGGSTAYADFAAHNYNVIEYADWVDNIPSDGDYWMRVTRIDPVTTQVHLSNGTQTNAFDVPFRISGNPSASVTDSAAFISVYSIASAPAVVIEKFNVEICKDDGSGLPDQQWASRIVIMEAIKNV